MRHYLEPVGRFPPIAQTEILFRSSGRFELKIFGSLTLVLSTLCFWVAQPRDIGSVVGWTTLLAGGLLFVLSSSIWEVCFMACEQSVIVSWKLCGLSFFHRSVSFHEVEVEFRMLIGYADSPKPHGWYAMRVEQREFFFVLPDDMVASETNLLSFKRCLGLNEPSQPLPPGETL
ncbi:MAG: hypothetical protein JNK23_20440 [Opitutaceae bacterium]|nr:hypothetical protein [Opitutaceae bacterium]